MNADRGGSRGGLACLAALVAATVGFALLVAATGAAAAGTAAGTATGLALSCSALASGPAGQTGGPVGPVRLDAEQLGNARTVYAVSVALGLPVRAAVVAEATAFQESRFVDVPPGQGDRDSVGLFQQRPSQGWGTPAQLMDPVYAATAFYRALSGVPGWPGLPVGVAAQAVQRSAPGAPSYQRWADLAVSLVAAFATAGDPPPGAGGGPQGGGACQNSDGGRTGPPAPGGGLPPGWSLPPGTPAQVVAAVDFALAQRGEPYVWGGTGPDGWDCSGLTQAAYAAGGVAIPRTAAVQWTVGTPVYDPAAARAGDLLFSAGSDPGPGGAPGHVALYLGGGLAVEAPHTGTVVQVESAYFSSVTAIRRIVPG